MDVDAELWTALAGELRPKPHPLRAAWLDTRRHNQTPPPDRWFVWLVLAGRGFGKTRVATEEVVEQCRQVPGSNVAVIGRIDTEVRRIFLEGPSGFKTALDERELRGGTWRTGVTATPGDSKIRFANGSTIYVVGAANPDSLRGLNLHMAVCDELASWRYADELWNEVLLPAVRLGHHPRIIVTTTPKPRKLLRELISNPTTRVTRGSTYDNAANLSPMFLDEMRRKYEGTRAGRQEIQGELLDDVEGALWKRAVLDLTRVDTVPTSAVPAGERFRKLSLGVDPADGRTDGDRQAITLAGLGWDHDLYVLSSDGYRENVTAFAERVLDYAHDQGATVVLETNHGGAWLVETFNQAMRVRPWLVPIQLVTASRGKLVRAEPVAMLFEQGRVHLVGSHPQLEDELCSYTGTDGEDSPDLLDSMVWALTPFLKRAARPAGDARGRLRSDGRARPRRNKRMGRVTVADRQPLKPPKDGSELGTAMDSEVFGGVWKYGQRRRARRVARRVRGTDRQTVFRDARLGRQNRQARRSSHSPDPGRVVVA